MRQGLHMTKHDIVQHYCCLRFCDFLLSLSYSQPKLPNAKGEDENRQSNIS